MFSFRISQGLDVCQAQAPEADVDWHQHNPWPQVSRVNICLICGSFLGCIHCKMTHQWPWRILELPKFATCLLCWCLPFPPRMYVDLCRSMCPIKSNPVYLSTYLPNSAYLSIDLSCWGYGTTLHSFTGRANCSSDLSDRFNMAWMHGSPMKSSCKGEREREASWASTITWNHQLICCGVIRMNIYIYIYRYKYLDGVRYTYSPVLS